MSAGLKGGPELKARLKAIKTSFKPLGRDWGNDARDRLARYTPRKTGATSRSYKVKSATLKRAVVTGSFVAYFIDKGTVEHDEAPKRAKMLRWQPVGGGLVFAKRVRHPRLAPRPFRRRAATEALHDNSPLEAVIKQWNEAAR